MVAVVALEYHLFLKIKIRENYPHYFGAIFSDFIGGGRGKSRTCHKGFATCTN